MVMAAWASEPLDAAGYAKQFVLRDSTDPAFAQIEKCLSRWPNHPFTTPESRKFRVLEGSVRVLGVGTDLNVLDQTPSSTPQLILVKPSLNLGSRSFWSLENPNGWYCFDTATNVGGKSVVKLACGAQVGDGSSAVDIGGRSDNGGVVVAGDITVKREDCPTP